MLAWGCWAPSPTPGKSHLRMMPPCTKQDLRQERGWVLMPSFVCLDPAVPGISSLGTLYFVMKNKKHVCLHPLELGLWGLQTKEFHNSSEQRRSLCISPSRPGVGSGTKQQNSRWVPGFQTCNSRLGIFHVFPMEERIRKSWAIWFIRTFEG